MFHRQSQPNNQPSGSGAAHKDLLSRADELIKKLQNRKFGKRGRRVQVKKGAGTVAPKRRAPEYIQKRLVVLHYLRKEAQEVVSLRCSDILIDGLICFASDDDDDLRQKIINVVRKKVRPGYNFQGAVQQDFSFVRVSNKKVRALDVGGCWELNATGVAKAFPTGAIYVRLTKDFKVKVKLVLQHEL